MRENLPVTQCEYPLSEGERLVSTTDLQSRITYCNPAFVQVSGYTHEELVGQPHNLVRHPDMPPEAFRDLWATVQAGRTWSACVKNRRKNGDHYWVMANVTPVVRDGTAVGFMSVRTKPTAEQVRSAEALYARMREEAVAGVRRTVLVEGAVQRTGLSARLARAVQPGVPGRIRLAVVLPVLAAAAALLGLTGGWLAGAAVAGVLVLGLALSQWLIASIREPLAEATRIAARIAAGDLSQTVTTSRQDEVGRLLRTVNQLNVNLQAVVGDVRREVDGVGHASQDVASGADDLSRRTENQASSLQQTAASVEELEGTVRQNADSARSANHLAQEASRVAVAGGQTMNEVVQTMQAIREASQRIADIVQVIDGIAFQTNILALNAAVEAARAGEHGRGFAVVAGEVRALAQRSSTAAREIKALIGASVSQVADGSRTVGAAGDTMREIVGSVDRVSRLIAEITNATEQQALGIGQVNQAVAELDKTTQQNAAMVEESAASATLLSQQAHQLGECVRIFHLPQDAGRVAA